MGLVGGWDVVSNIQWTVKKTKYNENMNVVVALTPEGFERNEIIF